MGFDGITPVDVARMFQPSTANVLRPNPNSEAETILKLFDAKPKSFTKLRNNYVGFASEPQLNFLA